MADQTDVAQALVAAISAAVYPNGTGAPSITGVAAVIYAGWPNAATLSADLTAGKAHVSVFPTATERVTQSASSDWMAQPIAPATLSLTVAANTVTVAGTPATGQNAAVLADGQPVVYAVRAGDTPTAVATGLATLLNAQRPASNVGAVVTVPGVRALVARVGVSGSNMRVLRRQEKVFQVSVWAASAAARDPLAAAIDVALAGAGRVALADGTSGTLRYRRSVQNDAMENATIFRRDILYAVEYAITDSASATQIVAEQFGVAMQFATGGQYGATTLYS